MALVDAFGTTSACLILLCLAGLSIVTECTESPVPVFIWTGDKSTSLTQNSIKLGHTLNSEDVQKKYLDSFLEHAKDNVVLFIQDELSIDDLAKYSGHKENGVVAFEYLKETLAKQPSLVLPSVKYSADSLSMVHFLEKSIGGHKEEVFSSDIDYWNFPAKQSSEAGAGSKLFVFHLPPVQQSAEEEKAELFSQNDARISKIMKLISSQSSRYTAVLTASSPSKFMQTHVQDDAIEEDYLETNTRRHLLAVDAVGEKAFFNYSGCIYMFAESITLSIGPNTTENLVNHERTVTGQCNKNQSSITIKFEGFNKTSQVINFNMTIGFVGTSSGEWWCDSLLVDYEGTLNQSDHTSFSKSADCSKMIVPNNMSYACGDPTYRLGNSTAFLKLGRFQVQPFISKSRFGPAFDCAPFFTIPILTGLFSSVVLISVIFVGLFAMMHIQATDRFDDPKAPTIQVAHEG